MLLVWCLPTTLPSVWIQMHEQPKLKYLSSWRKCSLFWDLLVFITRITRTAVMTASARFCDSVLLLLAAYVRVVCLVYCMLLPAEAADVWSIHREAPEFTEQSTEQEILATGIKVGMDAHVHQKQGTL